MASSAAGNKHIDCKDLHRYLRTLSANILDRLYCHPATCLAVFRELPHFAKHYVLRMLFVDQPVSQGVVASWTTTDNIKEHGACVQALSELRVWLEIPITGGTQGWALAQTFKDNLKVALLGGGSAWTGTGALGADKHAKDDSFLDNYAKERWECILYFMVGSREGVGGVSRDIIDILLHSGLMKGEEDSVEQFITQSGFQFLLMDTPSQVWYFMLQYLDTIECRKMDLVDTLSFLFQLSFSTLGKDYSTEGMTENQLKFLQHLREFGLVYQRKRKSQRYYPTRLAINLASGLSTMKMDSTAEGYIIVETNYKIYAYTDSSLHVALLALFTESQNRFQNMLACNLTRDSVREALMRGITAEQIINFLRTHAHPELRKRTPVLPPTITDQIRLWELERDRCKFSDGVLYNQFLSQNDFELLRDYAKDLGVLVYENPQRRVMIVSRGGHDDVKRFWKRQKNS